MIKNIRFNIGRYLNWKRKKLGFIYIGDEFYEPTGLYHPSYELEASQIK